MSVVLALGAAIAYGLSDFLGGVVSRRTSVWPVALTACSGRRCRHGRARVRLPGRSDGRRPRLGAAGRGRQRRRHRLPLPRLRPGADGCRGPGVGGRCRAAARGDRRRRGRTPVLTRLGGDGGGAARDLAGRPASRPWTTVSASVAAGLIDGILAGIGFGLLFAALGQVPEDAGFWPVVGTQVVSVLAVAVAAVLLGGDPVPRQAAAWWGLAAGVLATLAVLGFLLARQQGLLSVAAVLTSLYPAFTVLLATLLLGERLHRGQSVGLALCAVDGRLRGARLSDRSSRVRPTALARPNATGAPPGSGRSHPPGRSTSGPPRDPRCRARRRHPRGGTWPRSRCAAAPPG